ncbi:hypothetical protein PHLCEN_2v9244, partial [Hermanssonia centrifuga]
ELPYGKGSYSTDTCRKKYWRHRRRSVALRRPKEQAPRYALPWESSLSRWPRDGLASF